MEVWSRHDWSILLPQWVSGNEPFPCGYISTSERTSVSVLLQCKPKTICLSYNYSNTLAVWLLPPIYRWAGNDARLHKTFVCAPDFQGRPLPSSLSARSEPLKWWRQRMNWCTFFLKSCLAASQNPDEKKMRSILESWERHYSCSDVNPRSGSRFHLEFALLALSFDVGSLQENMDAIYFFAVKDGRISEVRGKVEPGRRSPFV